MSRRRPSTRMLGAALAGVLVLGAVAAVPASQAAPAKERGSVAERAKSAAPGTSRGAIPAPRGGARDLTVIKDLSKAAYIWGLPAEFMYRFGKYNALVNSPVNTLYYGQFPSAWNNNATNAGDSSVLYISGIIDVTKTDLVYTVPPTESPFVVSQIFDNFINVFSNPGTRTAYTDQTVSYLLVGPNSKYAHRKTVRIKGKTMPVIASPTNRCELLVRVLAQTLEPASSPNSAVNVFENVVKKYALNTLKEFRKNGMQPVYPASYANYVPTPKQVQQAAKWQNAPTNAVAFFKQMGQSLKNNPLPTRRTGLGGTPLAQLPGYIAPQPDATDTYYSASAGQQLALAAFRPIGLTKNGWKKPARWGQAELAAMQQGMDEAIAYIKSLLEAPPTDVTNYWGYINKDFGSYPNTVSGYSYRAVGVVAGGFPNIPIDGLYAVQFSDSTGTTLDGNNTYSITFDPPAAPGAPLPVVGTLPPLAIDPDTGDPYGFWSITLYQPDATEASAPFLSQASVLNTAYSTADTAVVSVDAAADTVTVSPSTLGPITASTPIIFDAGATSYGLTPGTPYYVASTPTQSGGTFTFQVSTQWKQALSAGGVPIQAAPVGATGGTPGPIVDISAGSGVAAVRPRAAGEPARLVGDRGRRRGAEPRRLVHDLAVADAARRRRPAQLDPHALNRLPAVDLRKRPAARHPDRADDADVLRAGGRPAAVDPAVPHRDHGLQRRGRAQCQLRLPRPHQAALTAWGAPASAPSGHFFPRRSLITCPWSDRSGVSLTR